MKIFDKTSKQTGDSAISELMSCQWCFLECFINADEFTCLFHPVRTVWCCRMMQGVDWEIVSVSS